MNDNVKRNLTFYIDPPRWFTLASDYAPFRSHRQLAEPGGVLSLFHDFQTPLPFY